MKAARCTHEKVIHIFTLHKHKFRLFYTEFSTLFGVALAFTCITPLAFSYHNGAGGRGLVRGARCAVRAPDRTVVMVSQSGR